MTGYTNKEISIIKTIYREISNFCLGKLLEIGPNQGRLTCVLKLKADVEVVEYDKLMCELLRNYFGDSIKIYQEDVHEFLLIPRLNYYETVVIFGFLYHSHAPLDVLERVVNNLDPKHIILETWDLGVPVLLKPEIENITGNRFVYKKNCGLVITINADYYCLAMKNLGYTLVKKFRIDDFIETQSEDSKHKGVYMIFERNPDNEQTD